MSNMREKIQELAKEYIGDVMCESWVNSLLSLFQLEMEKVIGEDEEGNLLLDTYTYDGKKYGFNAYGLRNRLRAEQRQKLANLINTIEEVSKR